MKSVDQRLRHIQFHLSGSGNEAASYDDPAGFVQLVTPTFISQVESVQCLELRLIP